jgi:outer membrane protein assembly factor BamA
VGLGYEGADAEAEGMTLDTDRDAYFTVSAGALLDGRDGERFPWSGAYLETRARQIGPGTEDYNIFEGTADARAFVSVGGRAVLALHSRLVYHDGDRIPLYMREHLGGSRTLRGYDYGSFHGANALYGGAEYRIPLNFSRQTPVENLLLGISLHVFGDLGAAWDRGDTLDSDRFNGTYGVGFTVQNRNFAPVRFDWGWRENDSARFEFDFGLKF